MVYNNAYEVGAQERMVLDGERPLGKDKKMETVDGEEYPLVGSGFSDSAMVKGRNRRGVGMGP